MNKKKIVNINKDNSPSDDVTNKFVVTAESKGKATQLRVIAAILWFFAIVAQVVAISMLFKQPVNMTWIIILIVIDLALAVTGSIIWKKSNRLDPASEKNKLMFFMQNQLGLVVAIIAFLPLIVFIFTNKNLDTKQKGILGGIAGVALLIAGISGVDFNPPSVEQYAEQSARVEELTGKNQVYWTKSGSKYHLYDDCHTINKDQTIEIFQGTVADARELKNINELCQFCENKSIREQESGSAQELIEEAVEAEEVLENTN